MSARHRRGAAASLAFAVLLALTSLVAAAGTAAAAPQTERLTASFTDLVPGSVRSTSWEVEVPRDAVVTQVRTTPLETGGVVWDVVLCGADGGTCVPVTPGAVGTRVPAGTHRLTVGVRAAENLAPGETRTLDGRIVFAEMGEFDDGTTARPGDGAAWYARGPLARTGATTLPLLLVAVAAASVGIALLLAARRRDAEEDGAPVPAAPPPQMDHRDVRRTP